MPPQIPSELNRYAEEHTTPPADHLVRLAEETRAELSLPQMLTGPVEGRLLETLAFVAGARRVLDVGTYSGYSALSMAAALPADGVVVTCEASERHADFARRHIAASPYVDRIDLRLGPALDTIATLEGGFDLVFIDADKTGYPDYFEACLPLLSEGGLIVIDNTLRGGTVLPGHDDGEPATRTIRALNERLARDDRVICVLLTVRDGVTLVRRR